MHDVVIVGAGVSGCAMARELAKYKLDIVVVEAGYDVACGASRTNSGIVHGGYDPVPKTLKARYNVAGARMFAQLAKEIGFRYIPCGSMVVAKSEEELSALDELMARAVANGVEGVELIGSERARELEGALASDVQGALLCHDSGICDPFGLVVALAEVAAQNGVRFCFNADVEQVVRNDALGTWQLGLTDGRTLECRAVVNCAGTGAFALHNQVSAQQLESRPRKGEYVLMSRAMGPTFSHTMFRTPTASGKGVLVSPTVEGNLIVGPTAELTEDAKDFATTPEGIGWVFDQATYTWPGFTPREIIARFAGVRPSGADGDFVVGEPEDAPGFYDVCAIDSPGLTSAPAIAADLAPHIAATLSAEKNDGFKASRAMPARLLEMSAEERAQAVAQNPAFGHIVCRCEQVSEAEILEAIHAPLHATTVVGVKRRCRAGTGRCQGGFCGPYVAELIARELGIQMSEVCEAGPGSEVAPYAHGSNLVGRQEAQASEPAMQSSAIPERKH